METKNFVPLSELEKRLHCKKMTLIKLAKNGRLVGAIKPGKEWLAPEDTTIISKGEIEKATTPEPVTPVIPTKKPMFNDLRAKVASGNCTTDEIQEYTETVTLMRKAGTLAIVKGVVYTQEELEKYAGEIEKPYQDRERILNESIAKKEKELEKALAHIESATESLESRSELIQTEQARLKEIENWLLQREEELTTLSGQVKTVAEWVKQVRARLPYDAKIHKNFPTEIDMSEWGNQDYWKRFTYTDLSATSPEDADELDPEDSEDEKGEEA